MKKITAFSYNFLFSFVILQKKQKFVSRHKKKENGMRQFFIEFKNLILNTTRRSKC
jgi:hypothetical protein